MHFKKGHMFHIYNQGNNRQKIFFKRENYHFFLGKLKTYILPYADILAWCLMPNHFHIMIYINEVELVVDENGFATHRMTVSHPMSCKTRTLNQSIAILLRSYTRAINKQNDWSGSLFRAKTKASCLDCSIVSSPPYYIENGSTLIHIPHAKTEYPQICFDYIHANPTKAGLVNYDEEWEFSSAKDFAGKRNGSLINKSKALKLIQRG